MLGKLRDRRDDSLVAQRYRIIRSLGPGRFGHTYIAEDAQQPDSPRCVIKQLKPTNNRPEALETARAIFRQQVAILERLGCHPQIPRLWTAFEEDQTFYLVEAFMAGLPLSAELSPRHRWGENRVVKLLSGVLGILEFAHRQGVVHGDLKPEQIIRRHDNSFCLTDFGAATPLGSPTEQPGEHQLQPSSDLYDLGIIGIQALTGLSPQQFQENAETGEILWTQQVRVSPTLAAVLTKLVRANLLNRYQSAAEALRDLQPLLSPSEQTVAVAPEPEPPQPEPASAPLSPEPPSLAPTQPAVSQPAPLVTLSESVAAQAVAPPNQPATLAEPVARPKGFKPAYWLVGAVAVLGLAGIGVMYAYSRGQADQSLRLALRQVEQLKAAGNYQQCVSQAATIPERSSLHSAAQDLQNECHLAQAKQWAEQRNFKAAILAALNIPANTPSYPEAQQLVDQWSAIMLELARQQYQQAGQLAEALTTAQELLAINPADSKAQEALSSWQIEWRANQRHFDAAQAALEAKNWQMALREATQVTTPYWQNQVEPLIQTASAQPAAATQVRSIPQPARAGSRPTARPRPSVRAKPPLPEPKQEPLPVGGVAPQPALAAPARENIVPAPVPAAVESQNSTNVVCRNLLRARKLGVLCP